MADGQLPDGPAPVGRVDPDDVLQEAYLAAAKRLGHYGADSSLSPFVWLRMVVVQTLIDVHRHHLGAQMRDAGPRGRLARLPVSADDLGVPGGADGRDN